METQQIKSRILKTDMIAWRRMQFIQQDDFKEWVTGGAEKLQQSLLQYQFVDPFKVWEHEGVIYCLDGKHRYNDLVSLEQLLTTIPLMLPATFIDCKDMKEAAELVLIYSSRYAQVTEKGLISFMEAYNINPEDMKMTVDLPGFDPNLLFPSISTGQEIDTNTIALSLQERFIVPPFSVLDTRQGYWQDRKKLWHSLGINSQATREDVELVAISGQGTAVYELRNSMREQLKREPSWNEVIAEARKRDMHLYEGASVFDPVLAELVYKWFCPPGSDILDPFAGGSVRGIVAGAIGYNYLGVDLRADQVMANEDQWKKVKSCHGYSSAVGWLIGDSNEVMGELKERFDLLFSCPPYHDLEQYSDDARDLSNMPYDEFLAVYRSIILKSVDLLKDNRFACFVVSDIRDKEGYYRNFVSDTIEAFHDADMQLYNEIILVNVAGSLPIRIGRQFAKYRKVGKMHQNVLVFYKGDVKQLPVDFPEIEVDELIETVNAPQGVEQL